MNLKKYIFTIGLVFLFVFIYGQEEDPITSIQNKISSYKQNDSIKAELILDLAWEYSFYEYRTAIKYCNQAILLSQKINYTSGVATALSIQGNCYRALHNTDSALFYLNRSLDIRVKQNRFDKIASVKQNIANVYFQDGDYTTAISNYKEAVLISENINDLKIQIVVLTNLASTYRIIGMHQKALETFNKAFLINKKIGNNENEMFLYSNLATIHYDLGNIKEALKYGQRALDLTKIKKDLQNEAVIENNLGLYYKESGDYKMAMIYYHKSLKIYSQLSDSASMGLLYNNIANVYVRNNQFQNALVYAKQAKYHLKKNFDTITYYKSLLTLIDIYNNLNIYNLASQTIEEAIPIAKKLNTKGDYKHLYAIKSQYYTKIKNYKLASESYKLLLDYTDSIYSEENNNLIANLGVELELNTKENEIKLLNNNAQLKETELEKQKMLQLFFIGLSLFFAIIIVTIFFSYKRIKKQNLIIENQKIEVELKNEEITHQKDLVEEKQKEIIDSINYAQRIQQAVLTGEDVWRKISKDYFILFKPKDIVSGDFYWAYNTPNGRSIFALADCTGHGVPGGFMSMLGNSFLNEIVIENKIFKADEILNKLRSKIINALEQKGNTEQKDGMDIALCVWNKMDNTLEYAGANNPLWLVRTNVSSSDSDSYRNENKQFQEYKADKMPIGTYLEEDKPFTSTLIQLQKNDIIFLTTDGFADQFGGPKGKKMKYKPMIELLIHNSSYDMLTQKQLLNEAFGNWIGHNYEQIDDVSVIGIRV